MLNKFTILTKVLIEKLLAIENHLRDCSEDIQAFSKFLANRLDPKKKETMRPWDFAKEWKSAIEDIGAIRNSMNPQIGPAHAIKHSLLQYWVSRFSHLGMMPIFAEDLCGKDFAEVAALAIVDNVGKIEPFIYTIKPTPKQVLEKKIQVIQGVPVPPQMNAAKLLESEVKALKEAWAADRLYERSQAPPFPPEPPVMIQDAEHTPAPPGHEFTGHEGWDC